VTSGALLSEAVDAADELLRNVYRLEVAKALNPLDPRDFLAIVQRLSRALTGVSQAAEADALRRALATLDVDWRTLKPAARERVVQAARQAVAQMPAKILPRVEQVLEPEAKRVVTRTRAAVARRFRIGATTARTDDRIAAFARKSTAHFVRDQYGQRAIDASERARHIVADGLAQGLGRDDIAAELSKALTPVIQRGKPYWDVVAMAFANRARTHTQLAAFDEAGIERFRFEAVLDSVTSHVCRFMHGREFSVSRAVQRFDQVERADDPEAIVDLQPWVQTGADEEGNQVLFFKRGGRRSLVAQIDEPALGRPDQVGRYSRAMSNEQLESAGICVPPAHARCRSNIVAEG